MKIIKDYVERIDEELEDAKHYAEKYVEAKAKGDMPTATKYKEMSGDELKHAMNIHEFAVKEIETIRKTFVPPVEMLEKWDREHKLYVERSAWIKKMLEM